MWGQAIGGTGDTERKVRASGGGHDIQMIALIAEASREGQRTLHVC
ncbi:hypothetical protein N185_13590 [Sinorhizobium sp. GW3]|nr:hypothetical protein N185_13590 [Sinorhizobium sp. GW3]KSV80072.1 hypothetical protein N182_17380 [Sinorhizobium sp. GL2]